MTKKSHPPFPVIDMKATGKKILLLWLEKGFTSNDLADFFGFGTPIAIYHWQRGENPSYCRSSVCFGPCTWHAHGSNTPTKSDTPISL